MSISSKITQTLTAANKKKIEFANALGLSSQQAMTNKFARGSWSAKDLITLAILTDSRLSLHLPDGINVITFTGSDLDD